jgi:hypothetical protein
MAIVLTDNRVIYDEADATTGWTGANALFTSAPDPAEATGSIGTVVSNATVAAYFTGSPVNMSSGTLVYVWSLPQGAMDTFANGGFALLIGDGTNRVAFHIGGSDRAAFRHTFWQCLAIDTGNLPSLFTVNAGSRANLNLAAITQIGVSYKTLAKSVGGVSNCFTDLIRYGNGGITITAGTVGDPGNFNEIALDDSSTANQKAHGIFRRLGTGLFGVQGPLTFGTSGTATTYFADSDATVVFEDRGFATSRYGITINATTTGTTTFLLGTKTGLDGGSNGVTFTVPTGVGAFFNASNTNLQKLGLYGCAFNGFSNGVTLSSDATNALEHEIYTTSFVGCGLIDIGLTQFKNNVISGSVAASALKISSTANVSNLSFTSAGTGHAIVIETPGTYDFNNFTYQGYASTNGTTGNEVLFNNSGGAVTINVSGGNTPTVRNGTGATTTIVSSVNITLTGMKDNTEVRVYEAGTATEIAGIEIATAGTVDNRIFTFSATPDELVDIITFNLGWISDPLRNFSIPSTNSNVPIAQRIDRVYFNPPGGP